MGRLELSSTTCGTIGLRQNKYDLIQRNSFKIVAGSSTFNKKEIFTKRINSKKIRKTQRNSAKNQRKIGEYQIQSLQKHFQTFYIRNYRPVFILTEGIGCNRCPIGWNYGIFIILKVKSLSSV